MICLYSRYLRRKQDGKAVPSKVQVPPLLRQRHNAALGLLNMSSFGPRSNLSLRPLLQMKYFAV